MSIFFNLGAEYTGLRLEKKELELPRTRILEALYKIFGEPSDILHYVLIQPKTELGYYRNSIRAIIKYNKMNEDKVEPKNADALSELRFIGLGFGKRPLSAVMPAGWRAAYGINPCCFRTECTIKDDKCDWRDKCWAKFSFSEKSRAEYGELKRKRATFFSKYKSVH